MTDPLDKIEAEAKDDFAEWPEDFVLQDRILILVKIIRLQRDEIRRARDLLNSGECGDDRCNCHKASCRLTLGDHQSDKLLEELK